MPSRAAAVGGIGSRNRVKFREREKMPSRAAAVGGIRKRNGATYIVQIVPEQPQAPSRQLQSSTPWYVVFIFVLPLQVGFLQLHFHDSSPFDTHPAIMWTSVFAILIWCFAVGYYVKFWLTDSRTFKNICDKVGYISGFLASAAFISVMVPPSFEPFVFVIWLLISCMFIDVARNWIILNVVQKPYHVAKDAISYVYNIWKGIVGSNDNVGAATLPL